ncbi:MAG: ATP phosphoribosyltransferase [Actinobacteria bacterium]|nr:ATP phosphoribosyltransferase [Actinomycetota bacterium]
MLSLVLPKGSLEKQVLELFAGADLTVIRGGDRDYAARIDDPRIDRVRFLRPQEIPTYVEQGIFDLGISGRDWVTETAADVVSLGEIGGGRAGEAVDGVKGRVFTSHGATEAKIPDIVDAIVDLTETGSSLRKAGLKVIETLLTSRTELLANRGAYDDPEKRAAMEDIALLLQGSLRARGHVLLKLNVPAAALDAVLEVLPSMSSPTVMPLAAGDQRAVETVVPKRGVNTLLPALRAAGARDILELPISKIIE